MFGKNTTGGAVVVTTTAPKLDTFEGYVEADIGNFDRNDFEGVVNVGGEDWAIRLGAAIQNRDGLQFGVQRVFDPQVAGFPTTPTLDGVTSETGQEFATDNEVFYRASVLYEPSDELSIRVNADYHETDEFIQGSRVLNVGALPIGGGLFFPIAVPTDPEFGQFAASQQFGTPPTLFADETNINATVKYDFGVAQLESITSYRDQFLAISNPFATVAVNIGQDSDIFAQELRLSGDALADRLNWQVGGFYSIEEGEDQDDVGGIRLTASENETLAFFGQGTYDITDQLAFTGGLRWTDENRSVALVTESRPDGFISVPDRDVSFDAFSWTAGLDYKVTDDSLVYASISRGFRSGGIDDERLNLTGPEPVVAADGTVTTLTAEDITVDPEFVINYEVGLKADFLNNTVRWNSAAFYSDYTDIQVQTFDPVLVDANNQAVITIANGAEAEVYGFETELNYIPNDNLSLGGTLGYTKADFQEFIFEDPASGLTIDRSDDAIGGPEWQASAFGRYEDDIADGIRAGVQLNYFFRGSEDIADGNDIPTFIAAGVEDQISLDSYGIFNGQIDFDFEDLGLNLAVYGQNLFDNEFDTTGFALIAFGQPLSQRNPGEQRTYGVRARKSF